MGVDFCKALNILLQSPAFADPETPADSSTSLSKSKKPLKKIKSGTLLKKVIDKEKPVKKSIKEKLKQKEIDAAPSDEGTNDSDSDDVDDDS